MDILLIEDRPEEKDALLLLIKKQLTESVTCLSTIQEGIEHIENKDSIIKLIVCDYHGSSVTLMKCLVAIRPDTPCIMILDQIEGFDKTVKDKSTSLLELVNRSTLSESLPLAIQSIQKNTPLQLLKALDSEFIKMTLPLFKALAPLNSDIFIKLSENKYLKIFRKDDYYGESDLLRYMNKTKSEFFYLRQVEASLLLERHSSKLNQLIKSKELNATAARKSIGTYFSLMQEVVSKSGFTPQVQDLAKKTVSLTLKVLGNNPKLSSVLKKMKQEEGQYIASHSIALAEISCAIACKVDWHSSGTFLKLSIAAFLHDISITDDQLAQVQTLEELENRKGMNEEEIHEYKQHPFKAAEFAKQFREIPPDVDTMILEHHERPDGSGFPRGLRHHQIMPLAALFIIAHDLLNYLLTDGKNSGMKDFLESRSDIYTQGAFGKIFRALELDLSPKKKS